MFRPHAPCKKNRRAASVLCAHLDRKIRFPRLVVPPKHIQALLGLFRSVRHGRKLPYGPPHLDVVDQGGHCAHPKRAYLCKVPSLGGQDGENHESTGPNNNPLGLADLGSLVR
jgi:hypothetical protein